MKNAFKASPKFHATRTTPEHDSFMQIGTL